MATTGLSPTVSEINGDFSPKSQTALCILHPDKGFLLGFLGIGISAWGQKLESWATGPRKMFDDIFSRLDTVQYTNVADRRTDGRTPADSKDRANAWRRAVKTTFAQASLYPVFYGIILKVNTAEQIVLS